MKTFKEHFNEAYIDTVTRHGPKVYPEYPYAIVVTNNSKDIIWSKRGIPLEPGISGLFIHQPSTIFPRNNIYTYKYRTVSLSGDWKKINGSDLTYSQITSFITPENKVINGQLVPSNKDLVDIKEFKTRQEFERWATVEML